MAVRQKLAQETNFPKTHYVPEMGTEGEKQNVPVLVSLISTVIINGISWPLIVPLNVLVIMAVKRRPRLQTNTNISLACLAATDPVLIRLLIQPSFILWKTLQLLGKTSQETTVVTRFLNSCVPRFILCWLQAKGL